MLCTPHQASTGNTMHSWYLEGCFESSGQVQKQALRSFPQTLGRDQSLDCSIQGATISRRHAILELSANGLSLRDLGSRNGTYINREKIHHATAVHHGDVLHLGEVELRIIDGHHAQNTQQAHALEDETCVVAMAKLSEHFPSGIQDLEHLIAHREITPVFQPIICAKNLQRTGFELLSRGANSSLPQSPLALNRLAESFKLEVSLSELMRDIGIAEAAKYRMQGELLVNTHPSEMTDIDRLIRHLQASRKQWPDVTVALEIHEQAITNDISLLKTLKQALQKLNMRLAFDDFGVGQSRLVEMVEAKPDLIKFDRVLIDSIDQADSAKMNLIQHLCSLAQELNITTLAEGVENKAEFEQCAAIGFEYYQGFYFCRPKAMASFKP